jgi:hypothetical protein
MVCPFNSVPFNWLIAALASVSEGIPTNANPLDWLVALSLMMLTVRTWPKASKAWRMLSSVVSSDKFPK